MVAEYQGWEAPYSLEKAQTFINEMKATQPGKPGEWYQIAIVLRSSDVLIGDCAFHLLAEDTRQAEIGITLAQAYQGHGYAQESLEHLLAYLFNELTLHRVRAGCDVENTASAHLLERLGMRQEAHLIENLWFKGRWSSEYWYAMLLDEWQHAHPSSTVTKQTA